jgi:hypothetical protein
MAILRAGARMGDLVFFGAKPGWPLDDTTLLRVLHRLGRTDATVHGWRSTFHDWAADGGKPANVWRQRWRT